MSRQTKNSLEEAEVKSMAALLHAYEMSLIPGEEELRKQYQLSDLFYHNMDFMIGKQEKRVRIRAWRRGCAAAVAGASILFAVSQPQMIAEGAEWLIEWFRDHVSFQFVEETDINWVPRYEFGYVPEGFEVVIDDYFENGGYIYYENEQGDRFDLAYGEIGAGMNVDNEHKDFLILTGSRGEKIYFLRAQKTDDESTMTWISEDGTTKFNMMGSFSEKEMLKLQGNIRVMERE